MSGFKRHGSLPPPEPKSPPYGKRRECARVEMLEREIGFLEEEVKSVDRIPPASISCKEVHDFVIGNVDPLIPITNKSRGSRSFWKWLCGVCCLEISWACCCSCSLNLGMPWCSDCMTSCSCSKPCGNCRMPKCQCWNSQCFKNWECSSMAKSQYPSCPTCSCMTCTSCHPKCPNLNLCSYCHKNCCFPCYFCTYTVD